MSAHAEHPIGGGRHDHPTFLVTTALGIVAVALVASVL
jgi:hypothetical protein